MKYNRCRRELTRLC